MNQTQTETSGILYSSTEISLGSISVEYEGKTIVFDLDVPQPVSGNTAKGAIVEIISSQNIPCPFCHTLRKCNIMGIACYSMSNDQSDNNIAVLLECAVCHKIFTAMGVLKLLQLGNKAIPSYFFENTLRLYIYPPVIIEGRNLLEEWKKSGVPDRTCLLYSDACRAAEAGAIVSAGGLMRAVAERTVKEHIGLPESKDTLGNLLKNEQCDMPKEFKNAIRMTCNDILHDNAEAHDFSEEHLKALKMLIEKMVDEWFVRPHKEKEAIKKLKSIADPI